MTRQSSGVFIFYWESSPDVVGWLYTRLLFHQEPYLLYTNPLTPHPRPDRHRSFHNPSPPFITSTSVPK